LMGNDYYELPDDVAQSKSNGFPPLGVGPGAVIDGAIIDKNCRIGCNARIVNGKELIDTPETPFGMIRDGIIVVPKETTIPDNWTQQ
jgi:glucose-1-phosphate adenylyltransferase